MEFREFSNPEAKDYDINSSLGGQSNTNNSTSDRALMVEKVVNLVGFLEDGEWEHYGITEAEYMNPNKEVIAKIQNKLESDNQRSKAK